MFIRRVFLFVAGNGSIVPEGGSVTGGKCQINGSLPAETVSLSLRVIYLMTLFCALSPVCGCVDLPSPTLA